MKMAIVSANLGNFEPKADWKEQRIPDVEITTKIYTDETFKPRYCTMTPRLQARIVKMFSWEMIPNHDCYLWVDSSRGVISETAMWFYNKGQEGDIVLFKHPHRKTIIEEATFIGKRITHPYLKSRYTNELIDEQLNAIPKDYIDDKLYASTSFFYWNIPKVRDFLVDWWVHTSRYHAVDQLALPYLVKKHKLWVKELDEDVFNCRYIPVVSR